MAKIITNELHDCLEVIVLLFVRDIEAKEEVADDGGHFAFQEIYRSVLSPILALETDFVNLLGILHKAISKKSDKVAIVLEHGFGSKLSYPDQITDQHHFEGAFLIEIDS